MQVTCRVVPPTNLLCTPCLLLGGCGWSMKQGQPWCCASTAQQELKHEFVFSIVLVTKLKHKHHTSYCEENWLRPNQSQYTCPVCIQESYNHALLLDVPTRSVEETGGRTLCRRRCSSQAGRKAMVMLCRWRMELVCSTGAYSLLALDTSSVCVMGW